MSLAYPIKNVKDLAHAFAAADEFMSALSSRLYPQPNSVIMNPAEDFYVAPYCFMRTKNRVETGFLVFSSMAPFIKTDEHEAACTLIKRNGHHKAPFLNTIEGFQETLCLDEKDIWTFTSDGCVPTAEDVSQELEDKAIRVVCDLMKWRYPYDWRVKRAEVAYIFTNWPVLDLAEYDSRRGQIEQLQHQHHQLQRNQQQQQQQQQQQHYHHPQQEQEHFYDARQYAKDDQKKTKEEKKETPAFDYLPLPPIHSPVQQKGGGFFERNADIFGNKFVEDDDGNTFISNNDTVVYDENDIFGDIDGI